MSIKTPQWDGDGEEVPEDGGYATHSKYNNQSDDLALWSVNFGEHSDWQGDDPNICDDIES
jgi:hypothetical protein